MDQIMMRMFKKISGTAREIHCQQIDTDLKLKELTAMSGASSSRKIWVDARLP
jgi:hypothetical protein